MAAKPSPRKKYGAEPRRDPKPPVPGYIWLLTGCALGAFVMFLLHLSTPPTSSLASAKVAEEAPAPSGSTEAKPDVIKHIEDKPAEPEKRDPAEPTEVVSQKPRYDFYRLLKENQAATPRTDITNRGQANTSGIAEQADLNYVLQVASYKTPEDAEQLRAKLLLLNLDAKSENVTLRNGDIWHRVLIGPVKSHSELTRIRGVLSDNKYDALVLKNTKPTAVP